MKTKTIILLSILLPGLLLASPGDSQKEKPAENPAINLWVDLGLGLISEEDAKVKMKLLDSDFESTMESEMKALEGDLHGLRQVTGKQFAGIVAKIDQITSFSSTSVIGMTKDRAYLEVKNHLTSSLSYVAIVSAPLDDLPIATRNRLREILAIDPKGALKEE